MKTFKYATLLFLIAISITSLSAQLRTPALSPKAKVHQTVGLTDIEITYFRPSMKGREIFSDVGLVPYGQYWRTGANSATKISLGDDIQISGQEVKKGEYAILTKPEKDTWQVYLYPYESTSWQSYVAITPAYTLSATTKKLSTAVETFTIAIESLKMDGAELTLSWDKTRAALPISVEIQERTMKAIHRVLEEPSLGDYFSASNFILQTGGDLNKALEYIQKVTKSGKALFFHYNREAMILKDLGRTQEAIAAAEKSLSAAIKSDNRDFIRLNKSLLKELRK